MHKTAILLCCTFFFIAILLNSCADKLNEPGYNGFRCAFGNQEYIADTAFYVRNGGTSGTTIYAQTGGQTRFEFFLEGNKADTIGTFSLDTISSPLDPAYYYDQNGVRYRAVSGSVTISHYYNDSLSMLSGSFSFTGVAPTNTLNFTYGYFNNIPRH